MKTVCICAFGIALLGAMALTRSIHATNSLALSNSLPFKNSLPLITTDVTNLFSTNAQAALKPQVYQASPYSCIVLVPKPVDTASLISPPSTNQFAIRTIQPQPPLHLEPVK